MNKTELAKQLNKKYQEIDTPIDWKTGEKKIIEWEHLPKTTQFVWERMAEWMNFEFNLGVVKTDCEHKPCMCAGRLGCHYCGIKL